MKFARVCMVLAALSAAPALAQDDAEDTAFDEALKSFGYAGGAALQCADDAGKAALSEDALRVFNSLAQLFGTDRAFFFAASFGAGTVDEIDMAACADYTAEFAEALRAGRAARGSE